jgi:hypothetical protein
VRAPRRVTEETRGLAYGSSTDAILAKWVQERSRLVAKRTAQTPHRAKSLGTQLSPFGCAIAIVRAGGVMMFGDLTVAAVAMIGAEIVGGVCIAGLILNYFRHHHQHR